MKMGKIIDGGGWGGGGGEVAKKVIYGWVVI